MPIRTIDSVVEDLADLFGVYGTCKSGKITECENDCILCCRVGFSMIIKARIYEAIENEKILNEVGLM